MSSPTYSDTRVKALELNDIFGQQTGFYNSLNNSFKTNTITVEHINLEPSRSALLDLHFSTFWHLSYRAYKLQPASYIVAFLLFVFGLVNTLSFFSSNQYLTNPYISFGLLITGIGMLATMHVAAKQ